MNGRIVERRREIEERVRELSNQLKLPLDITTMQRTLGPRPNTRLPPHGSEVYVTRLPHGVMEDTLLPLFLQAGRIYKFRLMIRASGLSNRGSAYITYETVDMAQNAIAFLNNYEISPGLHIVVQRSVDNRRIFIGGIPEEKSKDQVWQELRRIGIRGIVEVIMYRSYIDRNLNRGFVFVEFSTHEEASRMRIDFKNAFVFGQRVQIDWSAPVQEIDDTTMSRVKKVFVRHLNVLQERDEFEEVVVNVIGPDTIIEKVYKYRDYAFIHFSNRRDAQRALSLLKDHFKTSDVEVTWAKPVLTNNTSRQKTSRNANRNALRHRSNNKRTPSDMGPKDFSAHHHHHNNNNNNDTFVEGVASTSHDEVSTLYQNHLALPWSQIMSVPPSYCDHCLNFFTANSEISDDVYLERIREVLSGIEL